MLKTCPMKAWLCQLPTYNWQAYKLHKRITIVKFIKCKKVKCAIKFMRALLTNFLLTKNLNWKINKSMMNILGIANANR
jgi:hypothetical protein